MSYPKGHPNCDWPRRPRWIKDSQLNQISVQERICICKHFWFDDIENGYEPCGYCGRVRSVQDGIVDKNNTPYIRSYLTTK